MNHEDQAVNLEYTVEDWNEDTEALVKKWGEESKKCSNSHNCKRKVCKYSHMLILIITMICSYVFGSGGIIDSNEHTAISVAQSYVLLSVGILTTILKISKLEKRAEKHKKLHQEFRKFYNKIELMLALPVKYRNLAKIEKEYEKLMKFTKSTL